MPGWWRSMSAQNSCPGVGQVAQAVCSRGRAGVPSGSRRAGRGPVGRRSGSGRSAPRACAGRWLRSLPQGGRVRHRRSPSGAGPGRTVAEPERVWPRRRHFGVEQLQHVADGDVGEAAALGRDDHRGAVQDVGLGLADDGGVVLAAAPQLGEALGVAGAGMSARPPCGRRRRAASPATGARTSAPTTASRELVISSRRPEESSRPRSSHAPGPCARPRRWRRRRWPATAAASSAPGWSSSQSNSSASPRRRAGSAPSTHGATNVHYLRPPELGGRPAGRDGPSGGTAGPARRRLGGSTPRPAASAGAATVVVRGDGDGHPAPVPNSTSRVSGR